MICTCIFAYMQPCDMYMYMYVRTCIACMADLFVCATQKFKGRIVVTYSIVTEDGCIDSPLWPTNTPPEMGMVLYVSTIEATTPNWCMLKPAVDNICTCIYLHCTLHVPCVYACPSWVYMWTRYLHSLFQWLFAREFMSICFPNICTPHNLWP